MRNIRQNLFFAFIYNALGVPVAAGVLYPAVRRPAQPDGGGTRHVAEFGLGDRQRAAAARRAAVRFETILQPRGVRYRLGIRWDYSEWGMRSQGASKHDHPTAARAKFPHGHKALPSLLQYLRREGQSAHMIGTGLDALMQALGADGAAVIRAIAGSIASAPQIVHRAGITGPPDSPHVCCCGRPRSASPRCRRS